MRLIHFGEVSLQVSGMSLGKEILTILFSECLLCNGPSHKWCPISIFIVDSASDLDRSDNNGLYGGVTISTICIQLGSRLVNGVKELADVVENFNIRCRLIEQGIIFSSWCLATSESLLDLGHGDVFAVQTIWEETFPSVVIGWALSSKLWVIEDVKMQ